MPRVTPATGKVARGLFRGYDPKAVSKASDVVTGDVTPTQQHFRDEVDINTIVRRFGMTGVMPFGQMQGVYGDFSGITDFDEAVAKIRDGQERFMRLPPEVRERFGNDPARLIRKAQELDEGAFGALLEPPVPPGGPVGS